MVKITKNGVSLSASATANGMPLVERPFLTVGAGDYAARSEGCDRRKVRRLVRAAKSSWLEG